MTENPLHNTRLLIFDLELEIATRYCKIHSSYLSKKTKAKLIYEINALEMQKLMLLNLFNN